MLPPRTMYFFGLNAVRVLSVVSLILVFASSILVMVTNIKAVNAFDANKGTNNTDMLECDYIEGSTVPNQPAGVFWAVVATLLIIFQTIILFLSEISWPMSFFDRFFPVLGSEFGLGALGIFQCLIATQILSHHVDDFTLVSAFFLFSLGCLNMLLGLIFRASAKSKRSVRGWRAEAKGVLPTSMDGRPAFTSPAPGYVSNVFAGGPSEKAGYLNQSYDRSDVESFRSTEKASLGFGRQGEKAAGLRGFMLQKPEESLPRYVTPPSSNNHGARTTRSNSTVSSTSSWSSPSHYTHHENRQAQLHHAILTHGTQPEQESEPESRSHTPAPAFKSSQTAL